MELAKRFAFLASEDGSDRTGFWSASDGDFTADYPRPGASVATD